jgi:Ser/Thr protein kinase RdoA (MazF antagonist)
MHELDEIRAVLARYPAVQPIERIEALGAAGGFSGAVLWRVAARPGPLCLRRWPLEHPDEPRLRFIHDVLLTVYRLGIAEVPAPLVNEERQTFLRAGGALWELTPWMPGQADYEDDPRPDKLHNAMRWLARFHLAAAPAKRRVARSPGLAERAALVERLKSGEYEEIRRRHPVAEWPDFSDRAARVLAAFAERAGGVEYDLHVAGAMNVQLQPCIRDIHRDHVLFDGERVAGVVDFGAMRVECVAGDIARLLGSLAGNDRDRWTDGLAAYEEVRPLDEDERRLVAVFDDSGVLLSGMNWLRWICLEGRTFPDPERVVARLDEILSRLDPPKRRFVD